MKILEIDWTNQIIREHEVDKIEWEEDCVLCNVRLGNYRTQRLRMPLNQFLGIKEY